MAKSAFTDEQLEELDKIIDKRITDAFTAFSNKAQRIYRNWANQHDPKSDLVWVSHLSDVQVRNLIDYLIKNEQHLHYFADQGGKHNTVQCSGKVYKLWSIEQANDDTA